MANSICSKIAPPTKITRSTLHWTETTEMCFDRGCRCDGCYYNTFFSDTKFECKVMVCVVQLLHIKGLPIKNKTLEGKIMASSQPEAGMALYEEFKGKTISVYDIENFLMCGRYKAQLYIMALIRCGAFRLYCKIKSKTTKHSINVYEWIEE